MSPCTEHPPQPNITENVQLLIQDAKNTSVESRTPSSNISSETESSWWDPKAVISGQKFVRRHFFLVFFTHFISLILLLSYIPVRIVLFKTKRSHSKHLALNRYLSTLKHVKLWYEGDLLSPNGDAFKDVVKVRQIHSGVSKRLLHNGVYTVQRSPEMDKNLLDKTETFKNRNLLEAISKSIKDSNNNKPDEELNVEVYPHVISQLDMIVTQYCFMGLLTKFPHKFGLLSTNKDDMKGLQGFTHIWAIIGSLLGIQDRFNLCIGDKSELKEYILQEILLKDLAGAKMETVLLWESLVSAMSDFVPCLSVHAALLYILDQTLDMSVRPVFEDATLYEKFCYTLMIALFTVCFNSSFIRSIFNNLLRLAIYLTSLRLETMKFFING